MDMKRTIADNTPKYGETYYYLFANAGSESFEIKSTEWLDSIFDAFRFSRGNVFLSRKDAEELLEQENEILNEVKSLLVLRKSI